MVESREIRELCRNCELFSPSKPGARHTKETKIPSRIKRTNQSLTGGLPTLARQKSEGILMTFYEGTSATIEAKTTRPEIVAASEVIDRGMIEETAMLLINNHEQLERNPWHGEAEDNARTALFEALTASGHLSTIELGGAAAEANRQVLARLLNGLSDDLPEWEARRRFYEICEELIIHEVFDGIVCGQIDADLMVATISDFPESAPMHEIEAVGYRGLNKKGMCRVTYFWQDELGEWHRNVEQISRSMSTDGSSQQVLKQLAQQPVEWNTTSERVLARQLLASRTALPDGAVSLQQHLDEASGSNVLYGNRLIGHHTYPSYDRLRVVSAEREKALERYVDRLADYERMLDLKLDAGDISYDQKLRLYHQKVDTMLNEICLLDPSYAHDARGEKSAQYFEKAGNAMLAGDDYAAQNYLKMAISNIDPRAAAICGGNGKPSADSVAADAAEAYGNAKEDIETWSYKPGYCRLKSCVWEGQITEVGPCNVCRSCQRKFDAGAKPE